MVFPYTSGDDRLEFIINMSCMGGVTSVSFPVVWIHGLLPPFIRAIAQMPSIQSVELRTECTAARAEKYIRRSPEHADLMPKFRFFDSR